MMSSSTFSQVADKTYDHKDGAGVEMRNKVLGGLGRAEKMGKASVKTSNSLANNLFLLQSHRRSDGGRTSKGQRYNIM